jgi:hypothetical protein
MASWALPRLGCGWLRERRVLGVKETDRGWMCVVGTGVAALAGCEDLVGGGVRVCCRSCFQVRVRRRLGRVWEVDVAG